MNQKTKKMILDARASAQTPVNLQDALSGRFTPDEVERILNPAPNVSKIFILKPGTYYLGDPGYCLSEKWMTILEQSDWLRRPYREGKQTLVAFVTAYGDGMFEDQFGNLYGVDTGMIGLVPIEMAEKEPDEQMSLKVKFTSRVKCYAENGILHFGKYVIQTN